MISICIPTFNNFNGLKRAVESSLNQTYTNFELIITDDSLESSDHTRAINDLISLDSRISYLKNKIPLGAPLNWNKAMEFAKGDIVILLHHDDWFVDKYSLERLIKNFKGGILCANSIDFDLIKNSVVQINDNKNRHFPKLKLTPSYIFRRNFIGAPSAVMFKVDEIVFDEKLKWYVDSDFYYRKLSRYRQFSYANFSSVFIGRSTGQITNSCSSNLDLIVHELTYLREKYEKNFITFLIISVELGRKRIEFEDQMLNSKNALTKSDLIAFKLIKICKGHGRLIRYIITIVLILFISINYIITQSKKNDNR